MASAEQYPGVSQCKYQDSEIAPISLPPFHLLKGIRCIKNPARKNDLYFTETRISKKFPGHFRAKNFTSRSPFGIISPAS